MKRIRVFLTMAFISSLMLLSGSLQASEKSENMDEIKQFTAYIPRPFEFAGLVENPKDANQIERFAKVLRPGTINEKDRRVANETYKGNIEILSEPAKLEAFLKSKGIDNAETVKIIETGSILPGYVIYIKNEDLVSFIPLINAEKFGVFDNRTLYSSEEFLELCKPQPCQLVVFGKEIENENPPTVGYGRTRLPLREVIEAIGFEVYWDNEGQNVIFGECEMLINKGLNPFGLIHYKDKEGVYKEELTGGKYEIINGKIFVDDIIIRFLEMSFDIKVTRDLDKHIIYIIEKNK